MSVSNETALVDAQAKTLVISPRHMMASTWEEQKPEGLNQGVNLYNMVSLKISYKGLNSDYSFSGQILY